ncbi:MAG: DUF3098 domain-containing protein [Muribaculaceae bacterium]|nr:DUF3098 domain-containing protein [Muribaculaceae bacterium]
MSDTSQAYTLFPRRNLMMMGGCLALIIIGFILMCGGSSSVEGGFNPDIFSTRRIVVGPALAFLGFLLMAFAIILPSRNVKKPQPAETQQPAAMQSGAAPEPSASPASTENTH